VIEMSDFNTDLLRKDFVTKLQNQSRKYGLIKKAESKKCWTLGDMVNTEWKAQDYEVEILKNEFIIECANAINSALPFRMVSPQTLRRWCEISERFAAIPDIAELREKLSFDHFMNGRHIAEQPQNFGNIAPADALRKAVRLHWTADEMLEMCSTKPPPTVYDKAMALIISLHEIEFDWLEQDARTKAKYHLTELRKLIEVT